MSLLYQTFQKEDLENLNHFKDKIFSIVSHDFKTPLNSLKGLVHLMSQGNLKSEELFVWLPTLERELNHTSDLLDNILYWARCQMENIEPKPTWLNLRSLCSDVVDVYLRLFKDKNFQYR